MVQRNVLAMSGRAVEAAGDVDVLLLDKTGTITLGNRQATRFVPLHGVEERDLAEAAMLSSLSDETPEGRSIVTLAKEKYGFTDELDPSTVFIPFSAMTRMSGVDMNGAHNGDGQAAVHSIRKGASDSVAAYVAEHGGTSSDELKVIVNGIASAGSTPLVVAEVESAASGVRWTCACAGGHRTQRYRQRWYARALRRVAQDGHPHHHDYRRQSAHRCCHRQRVRCG